MTPNSVDPKENHNPDASFLDGHFLSHPPSGEEICITGISGTYPLSENIEQWRNNLYNKIDMVSDNIPGWDYQHLEFAKRGGKIPNMNKFDSGFFGISHDQANNMDPAIRVILERTIEAIFDAGLHPSDFEGSNTGVFIANSATEADVSPVFVDQNKVQSATGMLRCMLPNRISYFLKLKGPSSTLDSACSSALYALENAYTAIRKGLCDMAIVGGTNLTLNPMTTLQFYRLGVLAPDGKVKSFDAAGNGYVRSEGVGCFILQKARSAKRIYARVVHVKTNCDGFKERGITFPSAEMQSVLLNDFYNECGIDPNSLSYMEAHGTGTAVGDPEEMNSIGRVFCSNRAAPLLVGSSKSNMGHSEACSGVAGICKSIISMEEGFIPPNLNFNEPKRGMKALEEGRAKVVVDRTPFSDQRGLIAINNFGVGGANVHCLLHWNPKVKVDGGLPADDLPRLVCVSGRTQEGVDILLEDISTRKVDAEYINLLHEAFRKDVDGHPYRGYAIVSKEGALASSSKLYLYEQVSLLLALGDLRKSWRKLAYQLKNIEVFSATINRIHNILMSKKVNLAKMITNTEELKTDIPMNNIIGSVAIQIGVIEVLKEIELKPDAIIGFGVGELTCAYYDGRLTLEQTVSSAYEIENCLMDTKRVSSIYLIRISKEKMKKFLTNDIKLIWKSDEYMVMAAEHSNVMERFIAKVEDNGFHATEIVTRGVTKHLNNINGFAGNSKNHAKNQNYTFGNGHAIFEIGESCSKILKISSNKSASMVNFGTNCVQNGVVELLEDLGRLYELGFNPQIQKLYPAIKYPVSRGTPMIASKIKWNHSQDWFVYSWTDFLKNTEEKALTVNLSDDKWGFIGGHVIDGRILFPATGYIHAVWRKLVELEALSLEDTNVVFENCKFNRATTVGKEDTVFHISILSGSGYYEIVEGETVIGTGRIHIRSNQEIDNVELPMDESGNDENGTIPLKTKDIYKELHLRGYNYQDAFKATEKINSEGRKSFVKWNGNWISFMDNMMQLLILQNDSRTLFVPTNIARICINAKQHLDYVNSFGDNPILPVHSFKEARIIKCGGIEIRGMKVTPIARKKNALQPLLEKYEFVPNEGELSLDRALRVNMQIGLENLNAIKLKIVEVSDESTEEDSSQLSPMIAEIFADQALIQIDISVLSREKTDSTVENTISREADCHLIVGSRVLERTETLEHFFSALKPNGFILSRENSNINICQEVLSRIEIMTIYNTKTEKLVYFRRSLKIDNDLVINISRNDDEFSWLPHIQAAVKEDQHVIIYAQNEELTGILGLLNCIRKEPGGINVKCVLTYGDAPSFDLSHPFYAKQLEKNMAVNIYKNGAWGTYRHLLFTESQQIGCDHLYLSILTRGDLSTLKWIEGNLTSHSVLESDRTKVDVYYASVNFKDVMVATGRINFEDTCNLATQLENGLGIEFVGLDSSGKRVMGMSPSQGLATMVEADPIYTWDVPEDWTMAEAVTVPIVYMTAVYALLERGKLRRNESILIHSGTGGVGQAAINIALAYGCNIFTTVGNEEKRELIKKLFPELKESNIGCTRDSNFEKMVMKQTKGLGVDLVLNSLAEEKLLASVRCLAKGGRFLEIGKFDLANNNRVGLMLLQKECSFHGIMVDHLMIASYEVKQRRGDFFDEALKKGMIKPLMSNVFKMNEIEQAFRSMASGKYSGKFIIEIRDEKLDRKIVPTVEQFDGIPRYYCDPKMSYIVVGGLGGFGLELTNWLVLRGARKLILCSRSGVQNGYQSFRIRKWKSLGATVEVHTGDVTTREGCDQVISKAEEHGSVHAIFNLAVVLHDSLLENQTADTFRISFGAKVVATQHLDDITRIRCPNLRDFVVFSSVSCGRGNIGQTNYGMANSIMERICEKRRREGYPGLAIEWGAVGDVGIVAEMQELNTKMDIGGTLQQGISSCLQVMDFFLRQKEAVIVSSVVLAEKSYSTRQSSNIVDVVCSILGIKKNAVSIHTGLAEMGMDSMTAVEIKQILEREFGIFLTSHEIRNLTLLRLQELQNPKDSDRHTNENVDTSMHRELTDYELVRRYMPDEKTFKMSAIRFPSLVSDDSNAPHVFCLPGIEGFVTMLRPMAANINAKTIGIQLCYEKCKHNYEGLIRHSVEEIEKRLNPSEPLHIVAYSWGSIIGLETMSVMEGKGYKGTMTIIDGAPDMVTEKNRIKLRSMSKEEIESILLCEWLSVHLPYDIVKKNKDKIFNCTTLQDKISILLGLKEELSSLTEDYIRTSALGFLERSIQSITYRPQYAKINSPTKLLRPTVSMMLSSFAEDYNLPTLCENFIGVQYFEGTHITMLENMKLAEVVNEIVN